ncbi:hypothetical protein QNI19_08015 [Cytophagaceae bacterium DM2B3-1]|uniref:G8 domain-containing protein n=1 Tax=Xanthocytophaga flava TaxID=3048013 RepID=A0ABT7CGJ6_9BACT|nr:hypothetical protein [Xanthocytophaga flavus]MDJ1492872.1 hypothetical protein [Xanthocytophaga flavus]
MYTPLLSPVFSLTRGQTELQAGHAIKKGHSIYFYIFLIGSLLLSQSSQAASYTWNGSMSTDWNTAANWTPAGVPASTDDVTINTVSVNRYPVLVANTTLNSFTLNSGSIDLAGFVLTCNGTTTLKGGTFGSGLTKGELKALGGTTSFGSATTSVTIYTLVTVIGPVVSAMQNTTFNESVNFTKNGGYLEGTQGNNVFKENVTITMTDGLQWILAQTYPDTFYKDLTITVNKPNWNYGVYIRKALYKGNITTNILTAGVYLSGTQESTGKLIIGQLGVQPYLTLTNFISQATDPLTIELSGPSSGGVGGWFTVENSVFYGDVRLAGYQLSYKGCTFFRRAILQKSTWVNGVPNPARASDWTTSWTPTANTPTPIPNPVNTGSDGVVLNTFHGPVYILGGAWTISGWGNAAFRSVFNEEVTVNNSTNGYNFYISANTTADVFNKKLILTGSGYNMRFGINGAITNIPEGVILDATGLYGGLQLEKIVFKGTTERQLTLTGTTPVYFGSGFISEGPLIVTAPHLYFNGGKFLKPSTFTKTVAGDNVSTGGNVFKDKILIKNQATSGNIQLATQYNDVIEKGQ